MCRSGEHRAGQPRLLSTTHLWGGAVLRNWGRTDLQVPESWGGRAVLTESSLCPLSTAHYSLVVSLTTGHGSRSPFWASLSNGTPIWRRGVHKRDYLCTVPWRDGPRRLFEQLLGFPVLSPAYEDKEKIPHQNRCCAMRLSKSRRILCSPRPRMFSSTYIEKYRSSLSWFTLLLYKPPSAALTDLIVVRDRGSWKRISLIPGQVKSKFHKWYPDISFVDAGHPPRLTRRWWGLGGPGSFTHSFPKPRVVHLSFANWCIYLSLLSSERNLYCQYLKQLRS